MTRDRIRRAAIVAAALAVATVAFWAVAGGRGELGHAAALLSHPALGWVSVAVVLEALSVMAYAAGQSRLLRAAGHKLGLRWLAGLAVAAQALNNFLPAGYVAASVLNFRELRRRELNGATVAWVLLMTSALYIATVAVLAVLGSVISGDRGGAASSDVRLTALALLGVASIVGAAAMLAGRARVRSLLAAAFRCLGRVAGRAPRLPALSPRLTSVCSGLAAVCSQLSGVRVPRRALLIAASLFLLSWMADAGCLVAGFFAVGGAPPWTILPLAYCASQLVAFLPITPGGVGLMEGSLTVVLTAGGGGGEVLAAVLLYRMISYWATLPVGAVAYLCVRRAGPRAPARLLPSPTALAQHAAGGLLPAALAVPVETSAAVELGAGEHPGTLVW